MFAVSFARHIKCNKCNRSVTTNSSVSKGYRRFVTVLQCYTYFLKKVYTQKIMTETLYV